MSKNLELFITLGIIFLWFIYGVLYSTLRREAIKQAIFHYNNTKRTRPLLIWLFFTGKALYKTNIYCYGHNNQCTASKHRYDAPREWKDYQPDNGIAVLAIPITLLRAIGIPVIFLFYRIELLSNKLARMAEPK